MNPYSTAYEEIIMKKLTSAITLGLVLASGSAVAANTYGVQSDQEFASSGTNFQSATQFVNNEVVELDGAVFGSIENTGYDADLYRGSN